MGREVKLEIRGRDKTDGNEGKEVKLKGWGRDKTEGNEVERLN